MTVRSAFLVLVCSLLCVSAGCDGKDKTAPTWQSESAKTLDPALRAAADELCGRLVASGQRASMVVGITNGGKRWVLGYGRKSLKSDTPPDGDTLYEIGSVTKTFTATALALMVQSGRMKLDDPVSKYLPKVTHVPDYQGKPITMEHLATHTSALPTLPEGYDQHSLEPFMAYDAARMYECLAHCNLSRPPGEKWEYSSFGFAILGQAVSLRRGSTYEKMIEEMICRPLNMKDTVITPSEDQRRRTAPAYLYTSRDDKVRLKEIPNERWPDSWAGCGAIRSTVNDMLTYVEANIGVRKIPAPLRNAFDLAQTPRHAGSGASADTGLAWFVCDLNGQNTDTVIVHGGRTFGYKSYVIFNKEHKVGVVILDNGSPEDSEENTIGSRLITLMLHPETQKR